MRLFDQAMKAYEDHCAANGKPDSHDKAKEVLAGFAGAFIDREVETKGVRCLDPFMGKNIKIISFLA